MLKPSIHVLLLLALVAQASMGQHQQPTNASSTGASMAQSQSQSQSQSQPHQLVPLHQQPRLQAQPQQLPSSGSSLQAHLSAIQVQAQRQIGQLNGLVLNAVNGSKYSNVLEAISNVGKAIHQQISAATSPNHVSIVTSAPGKNGASLDGQGELANDKKNEYQSIVITDQGTSLVDSGASAASAASDQQLSPNRTRQVGGGQEAPLVNYREQGELLRQDIMRRVGQLQQVVSGSMDLLKNNGDLIVRRLLEQMNVRLDQAKAKADRIISEPATNEVALKALATINSGLNNLNTIISNIVNRLDAANQLQQQTSSQQLNGISQRVQAATPTSPLVPAAIPQLLDSNRLRSNLQQLTQKFHSALNGTNLHQQLAALRSQRPLASNPTQQQQQQPAPLAPQQQLLPGTTIRQQQGQQMADVGASDKLNTDFNAQ